MIALIQRVTEAAVFVDDACVGRIDAGLLALVAVEPDDDEARIRRMCERLLGYRVFPDAQDKMNLSLTDTGGGLLLVSQFTLAADTRSGNRPGFSTAAAPAEGERLYLEFAQALRELGLPVETGEFGADMQVALVNDGPVTIWMDSADRA